MRQQYETEGDLDRERIVAQSVASAKGDTFHKVPNQYASICDVAFVRHQRIVCYAEIKVRKLKWEPMEDVVLSAHKWHQGVSFANALQTPWMLLIAAQKGIYQYQYKPNTTPQRFRQVFGGRVASQRDNGDVEPVICIPTVDFTFVTELPMELLEAVTHKTFRQD